ncbi:MAG: tetratricopeptide repeat protein [Cyanobacteria bacterium SZAS TMP-1]|nr:tetratricopeptide repeat protein [Cyanobacteria bacterium SZAS TMP-1]
MIIKSARVVEMSHIQVLAGTVLMSSALLAGLHLPVFALSEREEEIAASSKHKFIQEALVAPAMEAYRKGDFVRALKLQQRAVEEWKSEEYSSKWAKDTRLVQMCEILNHEGFFLKSMGRFADAAQAYLEADQEWSKSRPESTHRYAMEAGETYVEGKMYDKAKEIFEGIISSQDPHYWLAAHFGLSKAYALEGNSKQAEKELTDLFHISRFRQSPNAVRSVRTQLLQLYLSLGRKKDAEKIQAQLQDKHCPKCGSAENVVPIGYGLLHGPAVGFHPGGCVSSPDSPRWWCNTDGTSF